MIQPSQNLIGKRFGRLITLRTTGERRHKTYMIECICDCGNKKDIAAGSLTRTRNPTISCGCFNTERTKISNTKHGAKKNNKVRPMYYIWTAMIQRCYNNKHTFYKYYGERGIVVCDLWRKDYAAFEKYMLSLPNCPYNILIPKSPVKREIDRYPNNNGNYEPGNVRWATREQQHSNKKNNRYFRINGVRVTLAQAARHFKISATTVSDRLLRGWSVTKAFKQKSRET